VQDIAEYYPETGMPDIWKQEAAFKYLQERSGIELALSLPPYDLEYALTCLEINKRIEFTNGIHAITIQLNPIRKKVIIYNTSSGSSLGYYVKDFADLLSSKGYRVYGQNAYAQRGVDCGYCNKTINALLQTGIKKLPNVANYDLINAAKACALDPENIRKKLVFNREFKKEVDYIKYKERAGKRAFFAERAVPFDIYLTRQEVNTYKKEHENLTTTINLLQSPTRDEMRYAVSREKELAERISASSRELKKLEEIYIKTLNNNVAVTLKQNFLDTEDIALITRSDMKAIVESEKFSSQDIRTITNAQIDQSIRELLNNKMDSLENPDESLISRLKDFLSEKLAIDMSRMVFTEDTKIFPTSISSKQTRKTTYHKTNTNNNEIPSIIL
jgi:hypothetical protein